eukprot:3902848-Rhodomonas_salina.2
MEVGFNFSTVRKFLLILFISTKMMSWVARNKQIKLFVIKPVVPVRFSHYNSTNIESTQPTPCASNESKARRPVPLTSLWRPQSSCYHGRSHLHRVNEMSARARPVVEVAALRALNNGFKQLRSMSSRPAHNFLFPSSSASSPPAAQVSHSTSTCEGVGVLASSFRPPMTVCSSPQTGSRCLTQTSSRFQTARKALSARQQAGGHRLWPMDNVSDKAGLHKMQLERSFFGSASPFS